MAIQVTHTTVATGTDAGNGEIAKAQWNEAHAINMATGNLLGRSSAGTGAVEEITVGTGLTLTAGTLAASGGGGGLAEFTAAESTAAPNDTVYVDSLTASAASTNADVAFVAKGTGATLAQVPDSTTAGGNKRGTYATDWQKSRTAANQVASGSYAGILSGQNNRASGPNAAVVGGSDNIASQTACIVAGGFANTATNTYASVFGGSNNSASSLGSTVVGGNNNSAISTNSAVIGGVGGSTRSIIGNFVTPACNAPITLFSQQIGTLLLGRQTTNATATVLTSNTSGAGTTNQVILPNNSAYYFKGSITAGVTGGGNSAMWSFEGGIKRGANAASTTLIQSVINAVAADAGASSWIVALSADTTNGGLAVTVTGQASTTIRWVCKVETTEMTF